MPKAPNVEPGRGSVEAIPPRAAPQASQAWALVSPELLCHVDFVNCPALTLGDNPAPCNPSLSCPRFFQPLLYSQNPTVIY